ncbi:MAG: CYTH domain-containing protein, partial [Candidatus Omnitrophica bacterium]|nr:CYTH domain-containing protein [Candidatus Omnitrophota bacterium]
MNYKPPLIKQEVEFKWRVRFPTDAGKFLLNAKKLGSKIGPPKYYSIHDYYFDTANHFFSTTHTKCRLRKINQRWQLTLKSSLSFHQGLARRLERTTKLPKNLTKQQALQI